MKIKRNKLILMHQTHSNKVITINNKNKDLKNLTQMHIITKLKGLGLAVVTADCVPILIL